MQAQELPNGIVQNTSVNLVTYDSESVPLPRASRTIQYIRFNLDTPISFGDLRNVL